MKKWMPWCLFLLLALSTLACKTVTQAVFQPTSTPFPTNTPAPTRIPPPSDTPTPLPSPTVTPDACLNGDCITSCLDALDSIVKTGIGEGQLRTSMRNKAPALDDTEIDLATYPVVGDKLGDPVFGSNVPQKLRPLQEDRRTHEQIWDYFTAIIPAEQRTELVEYNVFTDGEDNLLAAVYQSETSAQQWVLQVDIKDSRNPQDLTYTLVHEFAHLLSLNSKQVPPSLPIFNHPEDEYLYEAEVNKCPNYFPGEGCSNPDSYINQFFNQFWGEIFTEWDNLNYIEDDDVYYDALDKFYNKYADQFVTDYAATDPAEDFAETFSYFILQPQPAGDTVAEQKILFFYTYPELVRLRTQMGKNLCARIEK